MKRRCGMPDKTKAELVRENYKLKLENQKFKSMLYRMKTLSGFAGMLARWILRRADAWKIQ